MDTTTAHSQVTSGALHLVFLVLAFSAPVVNVLDAPSVPPTIRTVEFDAPRAVAPQARFQLSAGRPGPGAGSDEPVGPRPLAKVGPAEDADEPTVAGVTPTAFEGLTGALAGAAEETLGPDTEMALGRLDGGGGRKKAFGVGIAGSGVTCGRSWKVDPKTKRMIVKRFESCEAAKRGVGFGLTAGVAAAREAAADLGDKDEVEVGVVVQSSTMVCGGDRRRACDWKEIIGRVIRRHRRELRYCWEQTLKHQAKAVDAEVAVSFEIPPGGGTAAVDIETAGVDELDTCVADRASRWIFPETGEHIRANYPFRFWSR
jgi:hypothetical protein